MEFMNSDIHGAGNTLIPWQGHLKGAFIGRWICQLEKDSRLERPEHATSHFKKHRAEFQSHDFQTNALNIYYNTPQ